ncbi:MAG TPA: glutathione S-transferase family protein [Rhodopila sp.]|uniref:glutathione S-transferase family protein n=1 Tax=Rhodopila sp. TaxID=2480087 RepID=UPI002B87E35F|nr:glutathione S-transferase family protein [Rhodopila sp.]HVY13786.1 glutathione S-transferase family protein [Rhodopila sp.]
MTQTMTLHWSPRSPYVRKVMIAIHEMGLQDRVRTVRTVAGGTTPHLELMKINPLGKIPTLEVEDGTVLYDSPVIIEYLDTLHTGPKLFPSAWPERMTAIRRHALGQGMLDAALLLLAEGFRPAERQSEPHMALWRLKLTTCVDALEKEAEALAESPYSIGHLAIGVALGYLDFRFDSLAWRTGHPRLATWHETFNARPAVRANMPVDDR